MLREARMIIGIGARTARSTPYTSAKKPLLNPSLTYVNSVKQRLKMESAKLMNLKELHLSVN
jgi:hypothetical protein